MRRPEVPRGLGVTLGVLVFVLLPLVPGEAATYPELANRLREGDLPDTPFVGSLPEPRTPRQHWLRSQVTSDPARAQAHLRKAVQTTEDPRLIRRCVRDWLDLGDLLHPRPLDLEALGQALARLPRSDTSASLRLRYGRLSMSQGDQARARSAYRSLLEDTQEVSGALLGLAEVSLETGRLDEARDYLDRFMLEHPETARGRYWMLEARYHRRRGSDTEAYLAYHHLRNRYPNSLYRARAQQRLRTLSVPDGFAERFDAGTGSMRVASQPGNSSSDNPPEKFVIQVGSFLDIRKAEQLRDRLRGRLGRSVVVRSARVNGKRYHRVQIPGFPTREDADGMVQRLQGQGLDGFVRRASR